MRKLIVQLCFSKEWTTWDKFERDTRFYSLFVQGRFFSDAKKTNAVFFSNIWGIVIGYHKAQFHLVWLSDCWYKNSLSKQLVEERSSSFFVYMNNVEIIEFKTTSGSKHQNERYLQKNILKNSFLNMKSTTLERTMKKTFCPFQLPSSYGLGVMLSWRVGWKGSVTELVNELMTNVIIEQPQLHRVC